MSNHREDRPEARSGSDDVAIEALVRRAWTAVIAFVATTLVTVGASVGAHVAGRAADVCVWDWAVGAVATRRLDVARDLHERVLAWITLGDERNLVAARVAGRDAYRRAAAPAAGA